jgi:hypothetical protein
LICYLSGSFYATNPSFCCLFLYSQRAIDLDRLPYVVVVPCGGFVGGVVTGSFIDSGHRVQSTLAVLGVGAAGTSGDPSVWQSTAPSVSNKRAPLVILLCCSRKRRWCRSWWCWILGCRLR